MASNEQALISFFEQVAQKKKELLNKLKQEQHFNVIKELWSFTLPDLHLFLQQHDNLFKEINYKQFRKLIYNTPINQSIKLYNVEITIIDNQSKVDKSCYALVWHPKEKKIS